QMDHPPQHQRRHRLVPTRPQLPRHLAPSRPTTTHPTRVMMSNVEGVTVRDAVLSDMPALAGVFRRASLSNEGDRPNLLANPEGLEYGDEGGRAGGAGAGGGGGGVG